MPIVFQNVGFEWPNGDTLFNDLSFSLSERRYGLVGANGVGKSTLAKLIAGTLDPSSGRITRSGLIRYFAQSETPPFISVEAYLATDIDGFSSYDRWLHQVLQPIARERSCASLSGGEWCRVRLARVAMAEPQLLILDEPTNHLDREARKSLLDFLEVFRGGVLAISHDREFLDRMDETLELSPHGLERFSGGWTEYEEARDRERSRLGKNLETAKQQRGQAVREREHKLRAQAKRQRQGAKDAARGGMPKILLGARKRRAQESLGRIDAETDERTTQAVSEAWQAFQELKFDPVMFAKIPAVQVANQQLIVDVSEYNIRFANAPHALWPKPLSFVIRGPKKVALRGSNGAGKSTLLSRIAEQSQTSTTAGSLFIEQGRIQRGTCRFAYLTQSFAQPNESGSVLEIARERLAQPEAAVRSGLAAFLFQGESVHRSIAQLSGGELLRFHLALLLLERQPPEVLILDEPTNNLDLSNIEFLENALKAYQGAVILASHDKWFLERITLDEEIDLNP